MELDTLVIVLAGGEGSRLYPLTYDRSKPATPIGAKYRLIDIPLSNAFMSGMRNVLVLTQGKERSLNTHIKNTWESNPKYGSFVETFSPQKLETSYEGDADAVRQIKRQIKQFNPKSVLILPGDHVLKMNCHTFMTMMRHNDADLAIAAIRRPAIPKYTSQLGALEIDSSDEVLRFEEKNDNTPLRTRSDPDAFHASMGIYGFKTKVLLEALELEGNLFGKHILPQLIGNISTLGYDYSLHNAIPQNAKVERNGYMEEVHVDKSRDSTYWKDVGTIEQFFKANMDFVATDPKFNLYNPLWPFFTHHPEAGPAKFINGPANALLGAGAIMTDVQGKNVLLFTGGYADHSKLEDVIAFNDSNIQRCNIQRAIIDKDTVLRGMDIGYDEQRDIDMGIWVDSDSGVRVVPKEYDSTNQKSIDYWRREFEGKRKALAAEAAAKKSQA